MFITVKRQWFTDHSTVGEMLIDNDRECFTLEDTVRHDEFKVKGRTAIPSGTYQVVITHSNRFNREMPLLLNVPGFEGVRIHTGNTDKDTEGCILIGKDFDERAKDWIGDSREAFNEFFPKLQTALKSGKVFIEVG